MHIVDREEHAWAEIKYEAVSVSRAQRIKECYRMNYFRSAGTIKFGRHKAEKIRRNKKMQAGAVSPTFLVD